MVPRPHPRGLFGLVTSQRGSEAALAQALIDELDAGLSLLEALPPAVTVFGGARIHEDDPFYEAGRRIGAALARRGIPPRTGAGPGIMAAVPEGYRRAHPAVAEKPSAALVQGAIAVDAHATKESPQALTQGFNIQLPMEQVPNPEIEVTYELVHFPTRKVLLWEASFGAIVFPGGFGTLDELFEVWRLRAVGRLGDPIVLFGSTFWTPILESLRACWLGATPLADASLFDLLAVTDDPDDAVERIVRANSRGFDEDPHVFGERMARELVEGLAYLERLSPAVTVLGGTRLPDGSDAVRFAESLAFELGKKGIPTRASGPGPFSVALVRGARRADPYLPPQAFGVRRLDVEPLHAADRVHVVADRTTHKVLLTEGARALVALPGGLGTLDELFSIVCQLQTRKIQPRPVLLFGRDHWTPLLNAIHRTMLTGERQTIAESDLSLLRIVDDAAEAARLCEDAGV